MSTGDRDIADSLRVLRRLAAVAIWIVVALTVAFVGMTTVRFISLLAS